MQIVVLTNEVLKEELISNGIKDEVQVEWISQVNKFENYPQADAYIDLEFELSVERINTLRKLSRKPVIVHSVINNLFSIDASFIRINAWPTFLRRDIIEASGVNAEMKRIAEPVFFAFQKKVEWVPDTPGFISARIVAMIINEAYFALGEKVSTRTEIDTAMKLGTNYPYGPFEWSEKIGLVNIYNLLTALSKTNKRYVPSPQLIKGLETK